MASLVSMIISCVVIENLVDIILPSGKMANYIKSIVGIFIFAILLNPVIDLLKSI